MRPAQVLAQEKSAYAKVEPPCPVFGTCGGCALQDLTYADQLLLKRERLRRALASIDGIPPLEIVGLEEPWRYRNKAELTFGEADGRMTLGYHAARSFWRVVDLDDCLLLPSAVTRLFDDVRALAQQTGLRAYHARTRQGFFRYLLVRSSAIGRILICFMTTPGSREVMERMADALMARHPTLASVYWGVTGKLSDIAVPDELALLRGEVYLDDRLGPFTLRLHPLSFLQPSSVQADRLYRALLDAISEGPHRVAWDLYCGMGLIGLCLSQQCETVYAIDVEAHHVELAALNAAANGVRNIVFKAGRVETLLSDRRFWLQEAKPDVIVVDPPRAGLHLGALSSLLAARPHTIAYVSCNVHSLARDLVLLMSGFPRYRVRDVRAFDMFPQTNHAEVLTILDRK